ncbi:MAG: serine protease [Candidatus Nealsonbacteria bacterium]|nr:serine protease [Candidatus Nealsonbacteria bacterium]
MLKNILKIITIFIIGMVGGIFANQILWPYFVERPLFYQYGLEESPTYITETKEIIIQENIALKDALEKVKKTVAGVRTQTKTGKVLEGSGFIVTSDGLMVTLAELVPQGSDFTFFIDNESVSFQILKRDLKENLALIKISDSVFTTVSFARLEKLKMGERVFLIGVTFENEIPSKLVNEGIVKTFDENFIQTNILESSLFAGSPLFNIEGEVLGINTIDSKGRVIAIPISKIREFVGL